MDKNERAKSVRIALAAVLLAAAYIVDAKTALPLWGSLLLYLVPYFTAGVDVLLEAVEKICRGELFDEDFLMSIATLGALAIGFLPGAQPQFAEAVFVMLFFQIGELFESIAAGKSRRSIAQLMDIRPDSASVERDGATVVVAPNEVAVGEIIAVLPGEKIPLDGTVVAGESTLDTAALTGESAPRDVAAGDEIVSGCVNLSGALRIRVSKPFGESTAAKILELVESASDNKSKSENFITRFARIYTPAVVGAAVALALLPPLFSGSFAANFAAWFVRALTFLVVSCPCALVISVPLTFFGGIGGASRKGILIKGSNYMESLARTGTVVFDKTGTLTEGVFAVTAVHPQQLDERELLHLAAHVESFSTHPLAVSLCQAYAGSTDCCAVSDVREIAGQGVCALVGGRTVAVGNSKLMDSLGAKWHPCHKSGTIVHVALDSQYVGHVVVSDRVKDDAAAAVSRLKECGVSKTVMLTGDREEVAAQVAAQVKVDEYHAGLLPGDKVARVEQLLAERAPGSTLAFVGDGINDAPVLARADVGVAMGALGSDAAIEAADVVLMDDKPARVADAIAASRRTLRIARENIIFALGVKLAVLALAVFGCAPLWLAVFADVGVTVLAVVNAMRALK